MSRPRYIAKHEVERRYAANQELALVINKMLQAHERELRARMLVEMPRLHPVPPSIVAANQRALENFVTQREAAVGEFCDTIHDRLLEVSAIAPEAVMRAIASARASEPFIWTGGAR